MVRGPLYRKRAIELVRENARSFDYCYCPNLFSDAAAISARHPRRFLKSDGQSVTAYFQKDAPSSRKRTLACIVDCISRVGTFVFTFVCCGQKDRVRQFSERADEFEIRGNLKFRVAEANFSIVTHKNKYIVDSSYFYLIFRPR